MESRARCLCSGFFVSRKSPNEIKKDLTFTSSELTKDSPYGPLRQGLPGKAGVCPWTERPSGTMEKAALMSQSLGSASFHS